MLIKINANKRGSKNDWHHIAVSEELEMNICQSHQGVKKEREIISSQIKDIVRI